MSLASRSRKWLVTYNRRNKTFISSVLCWKENNKVGLKAFRRILKKREHRTEFEAKITKYLVKKITK